MIRAPPLLKLGLHCRKRGIEFLPAHDPLALIAQGAMPSLDDPLGLQTFSRGPGMVNILPRDIQFLFMASGTPPILCPTVRQHSAQRHFVCCEERAPRLIE
jgi:hypothetical protein